MDAVRAIGRRWALVAGIALLAGLALFLRTTAIDETYEATVVLQATAGAGPADDASATALARRTAAVAEAARPPVAGARVDAEVRAGALVRVAARSTSPEAARRAAAGVAARLVAEVAELDERARTDAIERAEASIARVEQQLPATTPDSPERAALERRLEALLAAEAEARTRPAAALAVVAPARADSDPVAPRPVRDGLVAGGLGALAGALLALVLERTDDRYRAGRAARQLEADVSLPLLGVVPLGDPAALVEAVRALRTNLMYLPAQERLRTLAVVGDEAKVGRTTVTVELGRTAADLGVSVVLVDADLRHPSLAERLGVPAEPGLTDVLTGEVEPVAYEVDECLAVVPAGARSDDPPGLLGAGPLELVLDGIPDAELLVVDTSAAAHYADALAVAPRCDATLVVVGVEASRRSGVRELVGRLRQVGANPLGVVVTTP